MNRLLVLLGAMMLTAALAPNAAADTGVEPAPCPGGIATADFALGTEPHAHVHAGAGYEGVGFCAGVEA